MHCGNGRIPRRVGITQKPEKAQGVKSGCAPNLSAGRQRCSKYYGYITHLPIPFRQFLASKGKCARGVQGFILPKKKPRGVSGGARFSFLSKEVTANTITGDRELLLLLDLDLLVFIIIFLLASKSCTWPFSLPYCSYTSLGQSIKSNSCANAPEAPARACALRGWFARRRHFRHIL